MGDSLICFDGAALPAVITMSIIGKWLIIGRFKPEVILCGVFSI